MTPSGPAGGRDAFERREWADSFAQLSAADASSSLEAEDLERLATTAYLIGEEVASTEAWQKAFRAFLEQGDPPSAVRCAFWLALGLFDRNEFAQAQGWLTRAQRVLDEANTDCVERGYLLIPAALQMIGQGRWPEAQDTFIELGELAQRFEDRDLVTFSRLGRGQCHVVLGRPDDGVAEFDEAMISVTTDEVSPMTAGIVYCAVIMACQELFDLRRAQEWTDALTRWCASQPDLVPYRGQCLVHRSELMQLRGKWTEAFEEAQTARLRLSDPPGQAAVGMAYYQLGELHRLRGDYDKAEEAYHRANEHGRNPEPGLALLRLAQRRVDAAAASSRRAVMEATDRVTKAKLLPAHVEIMAAAGDVTEATSAAEELGVLADALDTPLIDAFAARARGEALLAAGSYPAALDELRRALKQWLALEVPYECARTRYLLALACRRLGDEDTAQMEFGAAEIEFERLGAAPSLERVRQSSLRSEVPEGLTAREREVLKSVATGRTNREIAQLLTISEKTVARHVSNIFMKLGVSTRSAATAYAYEHSLV